MRELAKQRDKKTFISLEREDREKRDQIAFRTEPYFFAVAGLPAVPPLRDNHGFRGADVARPHPNFANATSLRSPARTISRHLHHSISRTHPSAALR
jgi:hypothetical protein